MSDDWGLLAEMQLKETLQIKKLSCYSNQTGLKLPVVTHKIKESKPNSNISNYNMPNELDDYEDEADLSAAELSLMKKILRTHLLETTAEVKIQRTKDNSPLYSVKSFDELQIPPNLLQGIYKMGFNAPSKIQESSLPALLASPPMNMIAQSQSGTGKTAAFIVASLARIITDEAYPQVLILSPTYELAIQIGEVARKMATFCPDMSCRFAVKGELVTRGETIKEHMIVGTPGKVFDWARRYRCFDIKKIKVFVLDEADVMISTQGHQDQCLRIHQMLSQDCQMLLFSATYTHEVMEFAEQIVSDPIVITVRKEEETLDNVHQYYVKCCSSELKYRALQNIYGAISVGQTIIFCRTKRTAHWLGNKFTEDGYSVGHLSSDLNVSERYAVISNFRKGEIKVLITTNVCARGIDIEQVTMVINFDLPVDVKGHADCETYLHRIGRTGRFGKNGFAVNLVSNDQDERVLRDIEEHFCKRIVRIDADDADDLETMNV